MRVGVVLAVEPRAQLWREIGGQPPLARRVPGRRLRGVRLAPGRELRVGREPRGALLADALGEVRAHVVGNQELRRERPAGRLLGEPDLLGAERLAVRLALAGAVRAAAPDHGAR